MPSPAELVVPAGNYQSLCNYLGMSCRSTSDIPAFNLGALSSSQSEKNPGRKTYLFYHSDMIWTFSSRFRKGRENGMGFVELHCSSVSGNIMQCSDGSIDLEKGIMNDGTVDIPLRAAIFVDNGDVVNQMNYSNQEGYFLQVLMKHGRINMILVTDEQLFRTAFNQQYLLGNFDRNLFEEVYNDYPSVRLLQVK
jgi:dolichyl-diphosphooligosaccharide--protein glycosyltransferase